MRRVDPDAGCIERPTRSRDPVHGSRSSAALERIAATGGSLSVPITAPEDHDWKLSQGFSNELPLFNQGAEAPNVCCQSSAT